VLGSGDVCSETTLDWEEWREIRDEMLLNRRQKRRRGFAQKIELRWKSFLCGPLRISAFSALMGLSTQRAAEIRRGRRENKSDLPSFVQSTQMEVHLPSTRRSRF